MSTYIGFFDGASRSNPGEAGAGAALFEKKEDRLYSVFEIARYLGVKTNNEAEYSALILLLERALETGITRAAIYGDSRLVVEQINRRWKIKLPHLRELALRAWELLDQMEATIEWIPREENKRADALSNRAIDEKRS